MSSRLVAQREEVQSSMPVLDRSLSQKPVSQESDNLVVTLVESTLDTPNIPTRI